MIETKPEEQEPQKDLGEFEQFVKNLLQVPKEEVDEITRQDRKKSREENPDPLEKKREKTN